MNHTVLLTGASRGIGLSIGHTLAKLKGDVSCLVMVARASETFDAAVEEVKKFAGNCRIVAIAADLSDYDEISKVYDELDRQNTQITTIINNAGYTKPASINETRMEDFERTMRVNLFSPFRIIQEAILRSHPLKTVVNIASTAGMNGRAGWLTYSSSKAAMINMSEVLRDELAPA